MNVDANVGMSAHFSGTKRKEVVSCTPSVSKKKKRNKQHLTADTVQNIVQTWITTTKQNFSQCILRIIRLLSKLDVNSKTEFYRLQIQTSKRFPRSHLNQNV